MSSEQNDQRVEFKYIVNSKNLNRIIDHVSKNNYFLRNSMRTETSIAFISIRQNSRNLTIHLMD